MRRNPASLRTFDWVDALAGPRFRVPLGPRAGLTGRADLATFGSDQKRP
jgi:hypothetical protein